jgi:cobalt/nickel transport system permease protein
VHLPDGFLDTKTWAVLDAVSLGVAAVAVKKASKDLEEKQVPMMGVMAAFIFAAQMLNFPVLGGTSGHLLGGVLAAILLGPWAAALVMIAIFIVQALFFQDGGLLALGANVFNMGLIGTIGGYYIYALFRKMLKGDKGILTGAFVAAFTTVLLGAIATAFELAISGTTPLRVVLPAMTIVHTMIGLGEAFITVFIIGFVLRVRRDLVPGAGPKDGA